MTVYLIGDSVRLASEPYTRAALPDAGIVSPSENCRSSHDVLQHIKQWTAGAAAGDIVHINCGLHDIRRDRGSNGPVADLETYRSNLTRIFDYLKKTGAKIIWADSTPFLESVHNIVKSSRRYLADLKAYNRVADDLAKQYGFAINDLYSLMFRQGLTALMLCDGLHFNEFGSEMIGKAVAEAVSKQM
ncbi:SGNH/GDSL hydrolase family protein [Neisseria oralis]|uniref:SGNH/GDSL hydrolase family protein n=1 Tax=Neisseria oralis TaxID=1107316 RepID=A0ABW8Q3S9_9NEIS